MNRYVKRGSHGIRAHRCVGNETPASLRIRRGRYRRTRGFQTCAAVEGMEEAHRKPIEAALEYRFGTGCRAWNCTTDQHDHGQACFGLLVKLRKTGARHHCRQLS